MLFGHKTLWSIKIAVGGELALYRKGERTTDGPARALCDWVYRVYRPRIARWISRF